MNKLLLLHGALGSKNQFDALLSQLPELAIYTLDFPGHGEKASQTDINFSIEGFAQEVLQWMTENKLEKTDIFGYSMGGYVALWLKLHHPEKIGRVMTLATKFNWSPESAQAETKFLDPDRIEQKVPAYAAKLAATHGQDNWKQLLRNTAQMMHSLGNKPLLGGLELGQISAEVLVSVGDRDGMVSIEESVAAYRWLPEGRFLVLPATQHPIDKADPSYLAPHIKYFFQN